MKLTEKNTNQDPDNRLFNETEPLNEIQQVKDTFLEENSD